MTKCVFLHLGESRVYSANGMNWAPIPSMSSQQNQYKKQLINYFMSQEEVVWPNVRRTHLGKFVQHLQAQRTGILTKVSNQSPKAALESLKAKSHL